jgi:hypothetical protein
MTLLAIVGVCIPAVSFAQWTQQTVRLQPGWNAVFFEVEPQPRDCDTVFRGIPVESVCAWNRRFTSVQFLQDPNTLLPDQPEWLFYFPISSPQAFLTNLFIVQGGRPYLIKLGGQQPADLVLTGRPKIRNLEWMSNSFNFVGFHINAAPPLTFAAFFAPSAAHAGRPIYKMTPAGQWQKVADPASETVKRGEAYWVYCNGRSTYQGPLSVAFDGGDGLDYSRIVVQQRLHIKNASSANRTVSLEPKSSLQPPTTSSPLVAGGVPLAYFEMNLANKVYAWKPLTGRLSLTLPAGQELALRLAVRRPDMVPYTPPPGRDALYQSLLEVADGAGSLFTVPVSAKSLGESDLRAARESIRRRALGSAGGRVYDPPSASHPRAGLWVGSVTINAVSNPTSGSLQPDRPLPVASPFTFRLIVHVNAAGTSVCLLQQVLQMWKEGAWIPNPNDPTSTTFILDPNNPGRTVLLTDDSLIPRYSGAAFRDVKLVGRRVSSAAFGLRQPVSMRGADFGVAGGLPTTCSVVLDYEDPVNPFKHKYHTDHDNFDMRFMNKLPEGKESYTVSRHIALEFTSQDPEDHVSAGWGDTVLGGIYKERIAGIHRNPVHVQGTFRLQHLSDVGVLNDGIQ